MELAALGACKLELKQTTSAVVQNASAFTQNVSPIQNAKAIAMNMQAPIQKPSVAPTPTHAPTQAPISTPIAQPSQAPIQQKQMTQVPEHIAQNQDSAQIWSTIVAAIPSLPTRAFYSGVAKLVT